MIPLDRAYYQKYEPVFGTWKIGRAIGEGSYGKVFELEREDFGRKYTSALKAITIPNSSSEIQNSLTAGMDEDNVKLYYKSVVEELTDEVALMSKLKGNSNIVSYEDHIIIPHEDGIGWDILVRMELLSPLPAWLKEHPPTKKQILQLGVDICRALELCQKHRIIHRDIKPANIFVSENGDFKLGDFGIARTLEKTTSGLSRKGTYTYMAPEVYLGKKDYGPTVDMYSLGLVLYGLFNRGRTPFLPLPPQSITYSAQEQAIAKRVSGAERLPPPADADSAVRAVIEKACAYRPEDRYANPTQMRGALEALLHGSVPISPPAPPPAPKVPDKPVRHKQKEPPVKPPKPPSKPPRKDPPKPPKKDPPKPPKAPEDRINEMLLPFMAVFLVLILIVILCAIFLFPSDGSTAALAGMIQDILTER